MRFIQLKSPAKTWLSGPTMSAASPFAAIATPQRSNRGQKFEKYLVSA